MAVQPATCEEPDGRTVPALQIVPRLETVGGGNGGAPRATPRIRLRAALLGLLAVAVAVTAVLLLTQLSRAGTGSAPVAMREQLRLRLALARTEAAPRGLATALAPGRRAALASGRRAALAGHSGSAASAAQTATASSATSAAQSTTPAAAATQASTSGASATQTTTTTPAAATQTTTSPSAATEPTHPLSSDQLVSVADGTSLYQPSPYLASVYRSVAARYHYPWRVLAALEYIQGGYLTATAGASSSDTRALATQVQAAGSSLLNQHEVAQASAAAAQPSSGLLLDARQLAADGASRSPAQGLTTFLQGTGVSAQSVLTLAQSIDPAAASTSATPLAKVDAMLNEARLLNGLPYVWGGGHSEPAWVVGAGYDCSGFVSEVLHAAGYLTSPETTQTLPGAAGIVSGPGKYVTMYDRTVALERVWTKKKETVKQLVNPDTAGVHVVRGRKANSTNSVSITVPKWVGEWQTIKVTTLVQSLDNNNSDEHVIIDIDGQWWESGGSTADGGAAMVHRIIDPSPAYLKTFNQILHPQGL